MSILEGVIILTAASFLMFHEIQISRTVANEIDLATQGWSGEWKINSQHKAINRKNSSHVDLSDLSTDYQSHLPPDRPQVGPKILWGVTSAYGKEMELRRREIIRATYLSYYKNNDHFVKNPFRICSLADVVEKKVHWDRCQLVYTFVMGGNPEGPEEFVDAIAPVNDYLADLSRISDAERDATYLDIKENQFKGKMQTWFAYASSLINEGYPFDYVAKADSDTMLYPEEFLEEVNQSFPTNPTRIYSGVSVSRKHCGKKKDAHCSKMIGKYYMGGAVEIMSADLVHHLASLKAEQRRQLEIASHEDISIGNFVLSHPKQVTKLDLGKPWGYKVRRRRLRVPVLWRHDKKTKQPGKWLANFFIYEKENRRDDSTHENILIVPTSHTSEWLIKHAIKLACARNRKTIVEYCAMNSFAKKRELFLSRMTTDIMSLKNVDGNKILSFQREERFHFKDPNEEGISPPEDTDEDNDEEGVNDEDQSTHEENVIGRIPLEPWRETVLVALRNPINDHLEEWLKANQPNGAAGEMKIQSKNQEALRQLDHSNVKTVYVVRAEHLLEDVAALEVLLGNRNKIDPGEWPGLTDPSIKSTANAGQGRRMPLRMCCQLQSEIAAYIQIMEMGQNLKNISTGSLHSSIQEVFATCGVGSKEGLSEQCRQSGMQLR